MRHKPLIGRAAAGGVLVVMTMIAGIGPLLDAQEGAGGGEWRFYGGDAGSTKYAPLDQINETNVKDLQIAWRWSSANFGRRPESNWQVTPLMVNGVLYFTAGINRTVVAADAATGETLWIYRLDEGERGLRAVRTTNRGLAYWTDGKKDERLIVISPGYQLLALDTKHGQPIPTFGANGLVDLFEGLDRDQVKPGTIGATSPAIVINDVVVVGAALQAGPAPVSKENVPGYIRGYDVRTGKRLWTFRTVPRAGDFGVETWENDSWKYTGNTGAWAPLSGDEELGHVYIPTEMATGDHYGGHRPGDNLFADSLVCLDAKTGKRVWHYQLVHHNIWDWDVPAPPVLLDVTVDGRPIKAVAQPTKQGFLYVFNRVTGEPVWPIEERPVPQSTVPGERTSPTQPFPTKPAAFDRQGITEDDLIHFTPELKAKALKILEQYDYGPELFRPPIMAGGGGKVGTLMLPAQNGAANWPGGAADPETGMVYVSSMTSPVILAIVPADPKRSDMGYVARLGPAPPPAAPGAPARRRRGGGWRASIGPEGLPLIRPPWGRITAIDLNSGEHAWMVPNGPPAKKIREHPALQGIDSGRTGHAERSPLMVTKTLLFTADGAGIGNVGPDAGGLMFRALDKKTGETIHEMELPAGTTGVPMTYMADGKQYIVVAIGGPGFPGELVALTLAKPSATSARSRSVQEGVYSSEQAERGKSVYLVDCAQCHAENLMGGEGATELIGSPFLARWNDQTLGDLYVRIKETMPLGSPNTLSARDYTDVVAYILSENEFPAGKQELPQSLEALKTIMIGSP